MSVRSAENHVAAVVGSEDLVAKTLFVDYILEVVDSIFSLV